MSLNVHDFIISHTHLDAADAFAFGVVFGDRVPCSSVEIDIDALSMGKEGGLRLPHDHHRTQYQRRCAYLGTQTYARPSVYLPLLSAFRPIPRSSSHSTSSVRQSNWRRLWRTCCLMHQFQHQLCPRLFRLSFLLSTPFSHQLLCPPALVLPSAASLRQYERYTRLLQQP